MIQQGAALTAGDRDILNNTNPEGTVSFLDPVGEDFRIVVQMNPNVPAVGEEVGFVGRAVEATGRTFNRLAVREDVQKSRRINEMLDRMVNFSDVLMPEHKATNRAAIIQLLGLTDITNSNSSSLVAMAHGVDAYVDLLNPIGLATHPVMREIGQNIVNRLNPPLEEFGGRGPSEGTDPDAAAKEALQLRQLNVGRQEDEATESPAPSPEPEGTARIETTGVTAGEPDISTGDEFVGRDVTTEMVPNYPTVRNFGSGDAEPVSPKDVQADAQKLTANFGDVRDFISKGIADSGTTIKEADIRGLMGIETGFGKNLKAPNSTASGLGQFLETSFLELVRNHGDRLGLGDLSSLIGQGKTASAMVPNETLRKNLLNLRFNHEVMTRAVITSMENHRDALAPILGREPSGGELYTAHFAGLTGAKRIFKALVDDPRTSLSKVMSAKAIRDNAPLTMLSGKPITVLQFKKRVDKKMEFWEKKTRA
jgi:hypothetical protein